MADEEHIRSSLTEAARLKSEGNQHHANKDWEQAIATYRMALGHLPQRQRKAPPPPRTVEPPVDDEPSDSPPNSPKRGSPAPPQQDEVVTPEVELELDPLQLECAKSRAVLNGNIAACFLQSGDHAEAAKACSEALKDDPKYVKVLQRRITCNDKLNTWTSLSQAQEDYNTLLELLPPSSPERTSIQRSLRAIKPRVEEAQKKETAEMLDKLKGIGNSILGKFGLSTDNFKFEPNSTGSYSMSFNQGK